VGLNRGLLVGLLLFGYSCLLLPLAVGTLFSIRPAVSLDLWFGPALIVASILALRASWKDGWPGREGRRGKNGMPGEKGP
jgi:hypothetical protein